MTEQTIFLAALDFPDPAKRSAYLTEACAGNEAVLRQVESLLAAHDKSGVFLDEPAVDQLGRKPNADTVTADATAPGPADDSLAYLKPPTRTGSLGRLAHYEVLEVLGRGGFGTVLRAFDDRLHRVVAIKVLAPQLAASGSARARFEREARAGAAVRDEHVVNVYAVSESNEPVPYLVMEFVGGQTLQQKLDRTGPLSVPEVLRIGSQMARGLAAAHATGLIHRDIKPSNILLENGVERVKITDFGLARAADDASISHSGMVAGTPMYMAPEQARGEKVDHRADLFSLGSVLYAMCTGRPPFRANTTMAVLKRVCEQDPRPVREVNPEVPDWLAAVIAKLHAKDPADRFQSVKEVADVLAKYLSEWQATGTVTVVDAGRAQPRPAPEDEGPGRPTSSGWLSWVVWTAFLMFVVSVAGLLITHFADKHPPAQGRLVLEDLEPGLEVHVRQGDKIVHERSARHEFDLPVHTHTLLIVYKAGTDTELFRTDFAIKADTRTVVNVRKELAAVEDRNRAGVRNNLAAIGRAVQELHNPRWVKLFNGTDLTGWQAHPEHPGPWTITDGVLRGTGARSILLGTGEFADFHLRCKVRISDGGDSGIYFRADGEPPVRGHVTGFEAQINATVQNVPRTGSLEGPDANYHVGKDPLVRPDEWFTYEVIVEGNRVQLKVNDQTSLDWTEKANVRRRGRFALQLASPGTVVEFESIEVRELAPDTDAPLISEIDLSTYQNQSGKSFRVRVKGTTAGNLYGTDVYTADSVLGLAAVHAGALKDGQTGTLKITILPGQDAYQGSTRNGVTSKGWARHPASFRIDGVSDVPAAPAADRKPDQE